MTHQPQILVHPSLELLQAAAAEQFVTLIEAAVSARGRALLAISGGSAPPGLFRRLCTEPLRGRMPWSALSLIWVDERLVPFNDPESNYRMARLTLLDHVPIPSEQIFPVATYYAAEQAAARYQQQVAVLLEQHEHRIDLVLLGMGPDGHTASLFPGFPQVSTPADLLAVAVLDAPKPPAVRISLTAYALNRARQAIFLVAGADKAPMVRAALQGPYEPTTIPAQLVRPPDGHVTWMLDAAAAAELYAL